MPVELPPLPTGHVRIRLRLPLGSALTPGGIARASGLAAEDLGPIVIHGREAYIDVRAAAGRNARDNLRPVGPTEMIERHWGWLRIAIGRNHGLSMGQLKRILQRADALPAGRILIQNTHTLVGLTDDRLPLVIEKLRTVKINGFAARPEGLHEKAGPGSPEFKPGSGPR